MAGPEMSGTCSKSENIPRRGLMYMVRCELRLKIYTPPVEDFGKVSHKESVLQIVEPDVVK